MSSSTPYNHVLLNLPLFFLPGKFYLNVFFGNLSSPILLTCSYMQTSFHYFSLLYYDVGYFYIYYKLKLNLWLSCPSGITPVN